MATNPLHNSHEAITRLAKKWRGAALTRPLWSIIDWPIHFENSHTRKLTRLPFVLLPTKHDGKSYRRLMRHEKKGDIFACWCLITQIAAKSAARGYLADEDGPYTPLDMADMTGMSLESFTLALDILASDEIRWIHQCSPDTLPLSPDTLPLSPKDTTEIKDLHHAGDSPDLLPTTRENSGAREEKRREVKGREEYPYRPQGDQTQPDSIGTDAAAQKKEGRRAAAEIASTAATRIVAMFEGATALPSVCFGQLLECVENGTLPAPEKKWAALVKLRSERAAIAGKPDDRDLCYSWLMSKEALCRKLGEALDIAEGLRGSAPARTEKKDEAPADWQQRLAELYPQARIPSGFAELPPDVQAELKGAV